jgi:secretion/DNA translocation related TadE-like protein
MRARANHNVTVTSDRGAASILALAAGLAITIIGSMIAVSASFLIAGEQARSAADLAALAGAAWAHAGREVACARAGDFAARNQAAMLSCTLEGLDLSVTVEVRGVRALAKAGPIRAGGSDGDR